MVLNESPTKRNKGQRVRVWEGCVSQMLTLWNANPLEPHKQDRWFSNSISATCSSNAMACEEMLDSGTTTFGLRSGVPKPGCFKRQTLLPSTVCILHSGRKLLPTDSLSFQINSLKTYRYRYRSIIISNYFLLPIPNPIPLQGSVPPNLPICNSSELIMENLPIPMPICNFFRIIIR